MVRAACARIRRRLGPKKNTRSSTPPWVQRMVESRSEWEELKSPEDFDRLARDLLEQHEDEKERR